MLYIHDCGALLEDQEAEREGLGLLPWRYMGRWIWEDEAEDMS